MLLLSFLLTAFAAPAPQDYICSPGLVVETSTGKIHKTGSRGELDLAISLAPSSGAVIECNGAILGVSLAIGEDYRNTEVVKKDPIRVTLVAGPDHVSIGPFAFGGKKPAGGSQGLAVEHLELRDLFVQGTFSQSPMAGFMDAEYGDIIFDGVTLLSSKSKTKWGSRIMGRARSITVRDCKSLGGGIEHPWYFDHPRESITFERNLAQDWGRTMLQVVTREESSGGNGAPPASGDLIIEGNTAMDCGWEGWPSQGGGYNFTVTGWPNGTVRFANNRGSSQWRTGLFVTYKDPKGDSPELLTPEGFQVGHLIVKDNQARYPNGDRDMVTIGSVRDVEIRAGNLMAGTMIGPKAAYNLGSSGMSVQPNGSETIDSRQSPLDWNLQTGQGPWRRHKTTMTPAEITALWTGGE